jgi:hypothetical protein
MTVSNILLVKGDCDSHELAPAYADWTTGIGTIQVASGQDTYDLMGRKRKSDASLPNGMYIVNGKKVIVNKK